MHYYKFHITDYIAATAHLSNGECLAYRRLIDSYMETEAPIPLETKAVSRRLRVSQVDVESVLNEYFVHTDSGWVNLRCDEEILAYHAKQSNARENGKRGGRPKKQTLSKKKTNQVILDNRDETNEKANHKLTTNHKPLTINHKKHIQPAADGVCVDGDKHGTLTESDLVSMGVNPQHVADWFAVRKAKRAGRLTHTALQFVISQALIAKMTLAEAIQTSAENEWRGFKAEWVFNSNSVKPASWLNEAADRSWADESFVTRHTDRSWREGL